jgi:hypothetical protein
MEVVSIRRDGAVVVKLRCPGCGHWGEINDDQFHGRVSVDHTSCGCGCTYHETHDFSNEAESER